MSLAQYDGRTADLLVFHGAVPGRDTQVEMTLCPEGSGGFLCTGVQKLAQRVLCILLLKKGTRQYLPNDGTTFMIDADRGYWRTPSAVMQSFTAAKLDLIRQLRALEQVTDPLDEQIDTVEANNITLDGTQVRMQITLLTKAATDYTFIAPITVVIR